MNASTKILRCGSLAALLLAAGGAYAAPYDEPGSWYVGGSIGDSSYQGADDATGFKGFLGYNITPVIATELTVVDFGSASLGRFNGHVSSQAIAGHVVGNLRIPNAGGLTVFGKLGVYGADTSVPGDSASNVGVTYGVGGSYPFTPVLQGRLEWERYADVGDSNTIGKGDIDLVSVGLSYHFR